MKTEKKNQSTKNETKEKNQIETKSNDPTPFFRIPDPCINIDGSLTTHSECRFEATKEMLDKAKCIQHKCRFCKKVYYSKILDQQDPNGSGNIIPIEFVQPEMECDKSLNLNHELSPNLIFYHDTLPVYSCKK